MRFSTERWARLSESYKTKMAPDFFRRGDVQRAWAVVNAYFESVGKKDTDEVEMRRDLARKAIVEVFKTHPRDIGLGLFVIAQDILIPLGQMTNRRFVFIPFDKDESGDFTKAVKGQEFTDHTGHVHDPVFGLVPWKVAEEDINRDLGAKDWFNAVHIDELVSMLVKGLSRSFAGKIKIFGCNSAVPEAGEESFTRRFANKMSAAGYASCGFYGYTRELKQAKNKHYEAGRSSPARERVFPEFNQGVLRKTLEDARQRLRGIED